MNKDKSIKDLKELNDKLKNQLEYSKFRICHLEMKLWKHDNNWNRLKEYLKHRASGRLEYTDYDEVLDKIKELENEKK